MPCIFTDMIYSIKSGLANLEDNVSKLNSDLSQNLNYSKILNEVKTQTEEYTYIAVERCHIFYSVKPMGNVNVSIVINNSVKLYGGYVYYPDKTSGQLGKTLISGNIPLNKGDRIQIHPIEYAYIYVIGFT